MARYLTIGAVLVAIGLSAALLMTPQPAPPTGIAERAEPSPGHPPLEQGPAALAEIGVSAADRTLALDACGTAAESKSAEQIEAEMKAQREQMLRVLRASSDADHLLVAAMLSWKDQSEQAMEMLGRAAAADPRNPMIASQALELCLVVDTCDRSPATLERDLIAADKANGLAWAQVASSRLKRSDEAGALAAMREAAAAPVIDEYFIEYVLLFDRGLAASTGLETFDRGAAAILHAGGLHSSDPLIVRDCFERAKYQAEWRDVCLRLAQSFEESSDSYWIRMMGMTLQMKMYEYGGDTRDKAQVVARQERFNEEWMELARKTSALPNLRDATIMRQYLETYQSAGEIESVRYLAAEAEARLAELERSGESACPTP